MACRLIFLDDTLVCHTVNYRDRVIVCAGGIVVVSGFNGCNNLLDGSSNHGPEAGVMTTPHF